VAAGAQLPSVLAAIAVVAALEIATAVVAVAVEVVAAKVD
jgi:hypothetical protein